MESGMQENWSLQITKIIDYAAKHHGDQQIISRNADGSTTISNFRQIRDRSALCALALRRLGIQPGDRVATLAWNTARHFECWYGIPGGGAICHTLNPRLFDKELEYIINHAEDKIIISDITFVDILERLIDKLPSVQQVIFLCDSSHMPNCPKLRAKVSVLCYEEILRSEVAGLKDFQWLDCDEKQAMGLCYTSGTTGNPKGVLYSNRSNFLLAMSVCMPDGLDIKSNSCFLVVVPMFHANSWGVTFSAPFVGAKLVLPGPHLDGESIYNMMENYGVTHTAGVPTVWAGLMDYLTSKSLKLSSLQIMVVGGAPAPKHMIEYYESDHGVQVRHQWGMTELSPFGTLGTIKGIVANKNPTKEELTNLKLKQGWPLPLVEMRIVNDEGQELPWDGRTFGRLQVKGPHTIYRYFKVEQPAVDKDGFFDTGDVATIDPDGHMQITDRAKDVIKSGGEWISSIEIENLAAGHPKVAQAAVIGMPDEKWGERPLLVVIRRENTSEQLRKDEILQYLDGKIAKWWMPNDVVFVESIPHTATGKISKLQLREQLKEYLSSSSSSNRARARL